jgi:hypothetical protein
MEASRSLYLDLGNDLVGVGRTDRHLTSQLAAGLTTNDVSEFLKWLLMGSEDSHYNFSLNQSIYTPENIDSAELLPEQRPYAAYLYVKAESVTRNGDHLVIKGFETGVVGPSSLGEDLQGAIHELTDSTEPKGWRHQLEDKFAAHILGRYARSFRSEKKWDSELVLHSGGKAGNVQTHFDVGALYRFGLNLPDDMGGFLLSSGEFTRDKSKWHAYAFAGAISRYVVYDHFLEGSPNHNIEKEDLVNALKYGFVIGVRSVELGYSNTRVSPQFKGQDGADNRGTIFLRINVRF